MKNEIKINKSKSKERISNSLKQDDLHDQFYFNERNFNELGDRSKFGRRSFDDARTSGQPFDDARNTGRTDDRKAFDEFNGVGNSTHSKSFESNLIGTGFIPALTRIGSDKSTDSLDKAASSSLSNRKPIGNLTPTKFEHLKSHTYQPTTNLQRQSNHQTDSQFNLPPRNQLNKEQSDSLNSIESTNLSESSSNRSSIRSPVLPHNQRSHSPTIYPRRAYGKPNTFKPVYSSSNNLFDSIQHLDIHKLINTDKRNQFCSTSTLPTSSSTHSVLVPKNAK